MRQTPARRGQSVRVQMRRMRAKYRRRVIIFSMLFFIIGAVAGVFAYRWYIGNNSNAILADTTPRAGDFAGVMPDMPSDQVPETDPAEDPIPLEYMTLPDENGQVADWTSELPEWEAPAEPEATPEPTAEPTAEPTPKPVEETEAESVEEPTPKPTKKPKATATPEPVEETEAESVEESTPKPTKKPKATATPEPVDETEAVSTPESVDEEGPAEAASAAGAATEETPVEEAPKGPQVIAIVPYGESFTYNTQIRADGSARLEAGDEPYETISFTQTMKGYMRPTDFASKYSTQYKLQGNEAGAGFELTLNDYEGAATVVPQNVIDVSLRSESGDTVERGYQLMDAEIAGNYGIALTSNTPKMLYKRYQYTNASEEMYYLVVTTYNDGVAQMILFELEDHSPVVEPEIIYNTLQRGIISDEVADMQARLIELGYMNGVADGQFGPMTEQAIKTAQQAFGMEPNGIADNAFQQRLFEGATPASRLQDAGEASEENTVG